MGKEIIIDDSTSNDVIFDKRFGRGLVPRDLSVDPPAMFAPPSEITLIPRSEWSARIKEMEATKSRLSDLRDIGNFGQPIPSINQGQSNYCWAHSTTSATIMTRAVNNQPYVPLSAFAVAATIKRGANEGGWCGLSAKFAREKGIPSTQFWPQGKFNYRDYDKPEVWANAALHRTTEDYVDLTREVYDQNIAYDLVMSCLFVRIACALDFNHWSHSVMGADPVEIEPGSFGIRIWNSWGDEWSERGMGILRDSKAIPDGAIAIRVVPGATS